MRKIRTTRLVLRNFTTADWNTLKKIIVQYMSSAYGKYDNQWPTDDEGLQGVCEWFSKGDDYLAVCDKESGILIGMICMNPADRKDVYNLGYIFSLNHCGRGYAYESCEAYISYVFEELGAKEVITGTAAENIPSCKLLERLGLLIVKESMSSFCSDAHGNPIIFKSYEYKLTYESWSAKCTAEDSMPSIDVRHMDEEGSLVLQHEK